MILQNSGKRTEASRATPSTPDELEHGATLEALRAQFEDLKKSFGEAANNSAQLSSSAVQVSSAYLQGEIRRSPILALGLAALAGALIGVVLVEARKSEASPRAMTSRLRSALPAVDMDAMRANVGYASNIARDTMAGLVPTVEHWAQSLSRMEAATMAPLLERGMSMAQALWGLLATNRGKTS